MRTYKPTCPICGGRNTKIRSSKKMSDTTQTLYCDCLDDSCLTRFKVMSETVAVISTLNQAPVTPTIEHLFSETPQIRITA